MTRQLAFAIVCEFVKDSGLRRHMLAVEAAMRFYAARLGEDPETWGLTGLLHDFDWEIHPTLEDHPAKGAPILRQRGVDEQVVTAILSHNPVSTGIAPATPMQFALSACDEITGLITAVALVRPTKDIRDVEVKSVKKKWKEKYFAAGVHREEIESATAAFAGACFGGNLGAEKGVISLFSALLEAHRARFGNAGDLFVGLQLTHSGRFCRPFDKKKLAPKIAYHHPILDPKFGIRPDDDSVLLTDDAIERIIDHYVRAARIAQRAGFHFVDVKRCHGYLGHEFLSAFTRKGKFGGDFAGRTRFAREIIGRIQSECPGLMIGVRLSAFDHPPFKPDPAQSKAGKLGPGIPDDFKAFLPYEYGFGCNPNHPLEIDLAEPIQFIQMLSVMGVKLINVTCGSPYYNPHIQRPAIFPPSDGYQPPEDPLVGVDRQIQTVRQLKAACRDSIFVGSGYSYLQEYLPHVAQAVIRQGWADFVGIGRMVLSYWDLCADAFGGREVQAKRICRTFSDCTTAPRNGIISGCYPLDSHYKDAPEHGELKIAKDELRKRLSLKSE